MRLTLNIYRYARSLIAHAPDACVVTVATGTVDGGPVTLAVACLLHDGRGRPITARRVEAAADPVRVREVAAVRACQAAHAELGATLAGLNLPRAGGE